MGICRAASILHVLPSPGLAVGFAPGKTLSTCFQGSEPFCRCRSPATTHASSPRDGFFYKNCCTVHFHRPNPAAARTQPLAFPPCRVFLQLRAESPSLQHPARTKVPHGGLWGPAPPRLLLQLLPREWPPLCCCSKDVNKIFLLLIPVLAVSVCEFCSTATALGSA